MKFSTKFSRKVFEDYYLKDVTGFIRFCEKFLSTNGRQFKLNWHQKILAEALVNFNIRLIEALLFRGYGKTEIIGAWCAWVILKHREVSILYITSKDEFAQRCVSTVQSVLQKPEIVAAFGDLKGFPEAENRSWAKKEFVVKRKTVNARMPTMAAQVLTGRGTTGRRAHITICDDITNTANTRTSQERDRVTKQFFEALWPVGNGLTPSEDIPFYPKRIVIGTPYAIGDLLHKLSEKIEQGLYSKLNAQLFQQGIYTDDGQIGFSHLDLAEVEATKINDPEGFILNYLCTYGALEGTRIISPEWIKYVSQIPEEHKGKGAWLVTTDAAFSTKTRADKTVYTLGYFVPGPNKQENKFYLAYAEWGKFSSPEAPKKLLSFLEKIETIFGISKPHVFCEMGKERAFWELVIDNPLLKDKVGKWIKRERAQDSKELGEGKIARGTTASRQFANGNVFFLTSINPQMISELTSQTSTSTKQHDDFYDTVVDFINYAPKFAKQGLKNYRLPTTYRWKAV